MEKELSLYLHFPFCKQKCLYCDFHSVSGQDELINGYIEALIIEMTQYLPQFRHLSSIYFGGGTPSYLSSKVLIQLLQYIRDHFLVSSRTEITVEVNPGTITIEEMIHLHEAGVNRLSIGLQARQDRLLKSIGRIHSWDDFYNCFELARETGFHDIGVDLMFGLPGQTIEDWQESLANVIALNPTHISAYGLQLETGTKLEKMVENGQLTIPEENETVDMMRMAMSYLPEQGFEHYEISNYAKPGFRSLHNLGYWMGRDYLGFGSGAHSKIYGERRSNIKDIRHYCENLHSGETVIDFRETIDSHTEMVEAIMLGLRLSAGINRQKFTAKYGIDLLDAAAAEIELFRAEKLLTADEGKLALTPSGIIVSNYIISSLLARV